MRPNRLVMVTGTGTGIGKTWVAAATLAALRTAGRTVAARKPAQSFDPADPTTDAEQLAEASGETPHTVCPPHRWYPTPLAPSMAAHHLGLQPPTIGDLTRETTNSWPRQPVDIGIIEGAGGLASPQATDADTLDLINHLQPDLVLVVAHAELGTLNLVRLTTRALADWPVVVHLNLYNPDNPLHRQNRDWLRDNDHLAVTTQVADLLTYVAPTAGHATYPGHRTEPGAITETDRDGRDRPASAQTA